MSSEVYWVLPEALKLPPPTLQPVALAVALRLVRLPPLRINPGLLESPRVRARVRLPLKTLVALPEIESKSPVEVYWVVPNALKVPPATDQLEMVAVAFKLVRLPPVSTSPGLAAEPSASARVLAPLKTSVADP